MQIRADRPQLLTSNNQEPTTKNKPQRTCPLASTLCAKEKANSQEPVRGGVGVVGAGDRHFL